MIWKGWCGEPAVVVVVVVAVVVVVRALLYLFQVLHVEPLGVSHISRDLSLLGGHISESACGRAVRLRGSQIVLAMAMRWPGSKRIVVVEWGSRGDGRRLGHANTC